MVLDQALYSRHGIKQAAAGTEVTEEMLRALRASGERVFYLARSAGELADAALLERVEASPSGRVWQHGVVTEGGLLAAEPGDPVQEIVADAAALGAYLPADGIEASPAARAAMLRRAEDLVARRLSRWNMLPRRVAAGIDPVEVVPGDAPGFPSPTELHLRRDQRVQTLRRILAGLVAGRPLDSALAGDLIDDLIDLACRFPQRFSQIALLTPRRPDVLPDHAYTTAALCVGMAINLQWSRSDVRTAGLAGLVADAGMALIPLELRSLDRALDDVELSRMRRHPGFSAVMLDDAPGLPEAVQFAAWQHHEREDGSGYPQGVRGKDIHDLARLVAVADCYAAMTEPRPYKPLRRPYEAMEEVIRLGSRGVLYRPYARALVNVCGLFPVGSFVRLSSGELALVVGNNPQQIDRPIVQVVRTNRLREAINLLDHTPWDLSVLQAADAPLSFAAA